MVNPTTMESMPATNMATISTTSGSMATTALMSQGIATVTGSLSRMHFPKLSTYWSIPGDQPNFCMWWTTLENYLYWLERHASPIDPIKDEDKNQLVCSLLPRGNLPFCQ